MNEIANNFLLARDKFMIEMHLRQPAFTYSACGTFTKNKERIQKSKETGDSRYIYQNKLDKALTRRTASDKIFRNKALNIDKNAIYDGYQRGLASMVYKFFDKKSALLADKSASCGADKNENMSNQRPLELATQELAEELHKLIIIKFEKVKVCSSFIDNILGC